MKKGWAVWNQKREQGSAIIFTKKKKRGRSKKKAEKESERAEKKGERKKRVKKNLKVENVKFFFCIFDFFLISFFMC